MSRIVEQIYAVTADVIKLFFMAWFVVMMLLYAALNIIAVRSVSVAEAKGAFLYTDVRHYLNVFHIDESKVTLESEPYWGQRAEFLGAPISLTIRYDLDIPAISKSIPMDITVKRLGINQSYSGFSEYGSYDLEEAAP